jgi:hypothetical protein
MIQYLPSRIYSPGLQTGVLGYFKPLIYLPAIRLLKSVLAVIIVPITLVQ